MNPNSIRSRLLRSSLLAAISTAALATAIAATAPPPMQPPAGQPGDHAGMHGPDDGRGGKGMRGEGMRGEGMRGGPMGRMGMMDPFMHALHQLDLTAQQRDKVREIMDAAHKSHEGEMRSMGENLTVIGNPGDPGYAAAIQAAKDKAAGMIQHHSDLDKQIYAQLTAEQKARLPKLLAEMKAKHDERKEQWRTTSPDHVHDGGPGATTH